MSDPLVVVLTLTNLAATLLLLRRVRRSSGPPRSGAAPAPAEPMPFIPGRTYLIHHGRRIGTAYPPRLPDFHVEHEPAGPCHAMMRFGSSLVRCTLPRDHDGDHGATVSILRAAGLLPPF